MWPNICCRKSNMTDLLLSGVYFQALNTPKFGPHLWCSPRPPSWLGRETPLPIPFGASVVRPPGPNINSWLCLWPEGYQDMASPSLVCLINLSCHWYQCYSVKQKLKCTTVNWIKISVLAVEHCQHEPQRGLLKHLLRPSFSRCLPSILSLHPFPSFFPPSLPPLFFPALPSHPCHKI